MTRNHRITLKQSIQEAEARLKEAKDHLDYADEDHLAKAEENYIKALGLVNVAYKYTKANYGLRVH